LLKEPLKVSADFKLTQTVTTEEFKSRTLCDHWSHLSRGTRKGPFFILNS
jgi:hypothetical protein